ncbi:unnamed protein product, partial [Brenthis ino]
MQPLMSPIDYEARTRAGHRADNETARGSSEQTPLLQYRFPRGNDHVNAATVIVVGCLLFVLLSGAIIENIVPPVDTPHYVRRSDWAISGTLKNRSSSLTRLSTSTTDCVVVLQTDTGSCDDIPTCAEFIEEMEYQMPNHALPYNYIITNEGDAYEYLGWQPSDYVPNRTSFVFAFIGNYTYTPPTRRQIFVTKSIIDELLNNEHLAKNYTIVGKDLKDLKYLTNDPGNINKEVDMLMFVILTRMYSNFTEAMTHM